MPKTREDTRDDLTKSLDRDAAYITPEQIEEYAEESVPEDQVKIYKYLAKRQAEAIQNLKNDNRENDESRYERYKRRLSADSDALDAYRKDKDKFDRENQKLKDALDGLSETEDARLNFALRAREEELDEDEINETLEIKKTVDNAFRARIEELTEREYELSQIEEKEEEIKQRQQQREEQLNTREASISDNEDKSRERIKELQGSLESLESNLEERETALADERAQLNRRQEEAEELYSEAQRMKEKFQSASEDLINKGSITPEAQQLYNQTKSEEREREERLRKTSLQYIAEKSVPQQGNHTTENLAMILGGAAIVVGAALAITGVGLIPGLAVAGAGAALAAGAYATKEYSEDAYQSKRKGLVQEKYKQSLDSPIEQSQSISPRGRSGAPAYDSSLLIQGKQKVEDAEVGSVNSNTRYLPANQTGYAQQR